MDIIAALGIIGNLLGILKDKKESNSLTVADIASYYKQLIDFKSENSELILQNNVLKDKLNDAYDKINSSITNKLTDCENTILKYIFKKDKSVSKDELCRITNSESSVIKYHIDTLLELDFITPPSIAKVGGMMFVAVGGNDPDVIYDITSKGREYVFDNLLS